MRECDSISIGELAKSEAEEISFHLQSTVMACQLWMNEMGKDKTVDLCAWFNEQPRLTARINTVKVSIEDCIKELQNLGWTIVQDKRYS